MSTRAFHAVIPFGKSRLIFSFIEYFIEEEIWEAEQL